MAQEKSSFNSRGFSLIEVVVAMGLLTMVSLGVAQLFAASTRVNIIARGQTSTTMLAEQKLEQIRSLTWGFDTNGEGLPVSDTTSDLTAYPSTQNGSGLNPSPADSLEHNSTGFVDFVDAGGAWVGTGDTPPGLWLPRPVINSTSLTPLICRSRSHDSARNRASAAVGSDSRRFKTFFAPNSASSNALRTG